MKISIQNKVQEFRKINEFTQAELAELVGVTRQTIISIEKGNYVPSVALALNISRTLGQKVETLFY